MKTTKFGMLSGSTMSFCFTPCQVCCPDFLFGFLDHIAYFSNCLAVAEVLVLNGEHCFFHHQNLCSNPWDLNPKVYKTSLCYHLCIQPFHPSQITTLVFNPQMVLTLPGSVIFLFQYIPADIFQFSGLHSSCQNPILPLYLAPWLTPSLPSKCF